MRFSKRSHVKLILLGVPRDNNELEVMDYLMKISAFVSA
jgi:hypothetical protein